MREHDELNKKLEVPMNHILLPARPSYDSSGGDWTIREIKCQQCKVVLCSLVIADVHYASLIWPFRVEHSDDGHKLVPREKNDDANAVCYGRAVKGYEAEAYLKKFVE